LGANLKEEVARQKEEVIMSSFSETEIFWSGKFGDEYTQRNAGPEAEATAIRHACLSTKNLIDVPSSILEFGANRGLNIKALRLLYPDAEICALEINPAACRELRTLGIEVFEMPISEFRATRQWDLVLVAGVLIHIPPQHLPETYDVLAAASRRWVLIREYHSPYPVEVEYRGHSERLWKRDFAGDFLSRHPSFKLVDYGFIYQGDSNHGQQDWNYFLLERLPSQSD
jgi:pseudaminic acid biosynthesis-associated methylase